MQKEFIRVRSTRDVILSTILIIAGCVLVYLPTSTSVNVFGFFTIFTGILLAFILKTAYKDCETGIKYCKTEHFFSHDQRDHILKSIKNIPNEVKLSEEDKGNAIRLDIYVNKSAGRAFLQLFEYIPYKYEPCSEVYEHEISNTDKLFK